MLKRLELNGFKSFADKTVFEFPAGITAIVGPNGSGKSNVVDAVRWLLGEQSAKALRGGGMADVIFNGSTGRKSLGLAEVLMVLDNSAGHLNHPAPEVQVIRRVYRDGQGEYLINGQPVRLKDVKDLFLGSGAGANALSIIEQGRVAALVEAPGHDHRVVFEEAAGISRYKAKKIEALRRLEKVESNLVRARDVLSAADERLRTVRLQAAKAQAYQQHAGRVRELRVLCGLADYTAQAAALRAVASDLEAGRAEAERLDGESRDCGERLAAAEDGLKQVEAKLATAEGERQSAREALSSGEAQIARDTAEADGLTRQLTDLAGRLETLEKQRATHASGNDAERERRQFADERTKLDADATRRDAAAQQLDTGLAALQADLERDRTGQLDAMRRAATLQNESSSRSAHLHQLRANRDRVSRRSAAVAENLQSLDLELMALEQSDSALNERAAVHRQQRDAAARRRGDIAVSLDAARQTQAERRAERSGLASRIEVLEALERGREGLGTGIRELLDALERRDGNGPPAGAVMGLVADLLTVPRDIAPLIDLALGLAAQQFVTTDPAALAAYLESRSQPFAGRVSFLPVRPVLSADVAPAGPAGARRADALVTCDHFALAGLPRQLLGSTLIVPDLTTARELLARSPGHRCVTLLGELLEADGTLTVGQHHAEAGILSRKSELRELRSQMQRLAALIADGEEEIAALADELARLDAELRKLTQEGEVLAEQVADLRSRVGQHRSRRDGLQAEATTHDEELASLEALVRTAEADDERARGEAETAEVTAGQLGQRVARTETTLREQEAARQAAHAAAAAVRVALAQAEARLARAEERCRQFRIEADRLTAEATALTEQQAALTERRTAATERATALAAALTAARERLARSEAERRGDIDRRDTLRAERDGLRQRMQSAQSDWQARQGRLHALELRSRDLQHKQDAASAALREEYAFDLPAHHAEGATVPDEFDAASAASEIDELKRKLTRLGHVNLAALDELEEAELKATELRVKHDDLAAAQTSLAEIITRINSDSERLFVETFALIRANFQELFRKLFGGGMADVRLDDESDPLESGISIEARPPGKELRRIGLMSGGEKSLTAVALLLAIFRSKPSPFCILDEVDAALDEANTAQLAAALREFCDRSQFIVVTHHKRSMAAADVLYGITMQEGGVSKRVSVRFEEFERKAA